MSKPTEPTATTNKLPAIVQTSEKDRLEYLAALLLEIIDEELRESGVDICIQN